MAMRPTRKPGEDRSRQHVAAWLVVMVVPLLALAVRPNLSTPVAGADATTPIELLTPGWTLPPEKQADIDAQANARAAAAAANARAGIIKANDPGRPPESAGDQGAIPQPHIAAGSGTLVEWDQPAPGSSLPVLNQWFEDSGDGVFVSVYAGGDPASRNASVIQVALGGLPGGFVRKVERYDAPGGHGPLRIVGATAEVLELAAADGSILHFDVGGRKFK